MKMRDKTETTKVGLLSAELTLRHAATLVQDKRVINHLLAKAEEFHELACTEWGAVGGLIDKIDADMLSDVPKRPQHQ